MVARGTVRQDPAPGFPFTFRFPLAVSEHSHYEYELTLVKWEMLKLGK